MAVVGDRYWVLVDCGRAATQRALDAGLQLTSVVSVAITHHHSDHELAQGVDVLVHEALLSSRVPADLLTWNASARAVGELAARTRPNTLVLTHLIPAPRSPDDEHAYIEEVRTGGFEGRVLVARDLLHVDTET